MNKMSNNLMMINKIIIFTKSIFDEELDSEYFVEKLLYDLNFIIKSLDDFWIEYLKFIDVYKKDNFIKSYSFSIKRFYNLLNKIKSNIKLLNKYNLDESVINSFIINIEEKIELITEHNSRSTLINTQEQCINEEEYFLLLNDPDNDETK